LYSTLNPAGDCGHDKRAAWTGWFLRLRLGRRRTPLVSKQNIRSEITVTAR
jgi:hypothetical protein